MYIALAVAAAKHFSSHAAAAVVKSASKRVFRLLLAQSAFLNLSLFVALVVSGMSAIVVHVVGLLEGLGGVLPCSICAVLDSTPPASGQP